MNCPHCGKVIQEDAKFCMGCGQRIPRCPTCGTVLLKRAKFCMVDGTRIPDEINALIPEAQEAAAPPTVVVDVPKAVEKPVMEKPVQVERPPHPVQHPVAPAQKAAPNKAGKKKVTILILVIVAVVIFFVAGFFAIKMLLGSNMFKAVLPDREETGKELTAQPVETENIAEQAQEETEPIQETEPVQEETKPTEPEPILMPDCIGSHYDEVVQFFEQVPCQVKFEYAYSDTIEENYILEQSLMEGSEVTEDLEILLVVSKGPDAAPEGYNQKVTVTAESGSSYGLLTLYDWEDGEWVSKFSCNATLGSKGISPDYGEGKKRTPEGVFKLGVALTANSLSNSDWPAYLVSSDTCVVDDVNSPDYNTIQSIKSLASGVSYDPIGRTITQGTSNICIYIEHNGNGYDSENVEAGKGSVITICGRSSTPKPTSGCVDISASNMKNLISMLSYEKNPHIEIYTE